MLNLLLDKLLRNIWLVILVFLFIIGFGVYAIYNTPVDAIPDLSENQVIVYADWPGQNPQTIEDLVTYPLVTNLQGLAGVKTIRAASMPGFSLLYVIFKDDIDLYFARTRVAERLSLIQKNLPEGIIPVLGPDATGVGHIFMYTLKSPNHSLTQLRSIQDYIVRYALGSVDGVAEVASLGGYVKEYKILLNPLKLELFKLSAEEVADSLEKASMNVSGNILEIGAKEIFVQGTGFLSNIEEIENIVVGQHHDGTALRVADVAEVKIGSSQRRTILADAEGEQVGGVIVARYGVNPLDVIKRVKAKIKEIEPSLPHGVSVDIFYDRTNLIKASINTLAQTIIETLIIVTAVVVLFFGSLSGSLIISLALIIGVLIAFIFMYLFSIPSNIMSLAGIAIGTGMMVDASIVISENTAKLIAEFKPQNFKEKLKIIKKAAGEVLWPIISSALIIILAFLPVFGLTGMEGKLFSPLAFTKTFAMMGALITSVFLVPVLCALLLKNCKPETENKMVVLFHKLYRPLLNFALNRKKTLLALCGVLLAGGVYAASWVGSEFMPPLDETSILYMPVALPNTSESQMREFLITTNKIIAQIPEVAKIAGKAGRAETATDPAPLSMIETFVTLKPKSEWREGITKEDIVRQINKSIKIPNLWNSFTQPIIGRIEMLSTGVRTQLGLKIYGDDSFQLENLAIDAESILQNVPGSADVTAIRTTGLEYLIVDFDEKKLAQYGIPKLNALNALSVGTGGMIVAKTIEGRERYPIELRIQRQYRQKPEDIQSIIVEGTSGQKVPLSSLGEIKLIKGPSEINSENGRIRSLVQLNVRGRDIGSFVEEAQKTIAEQLKLPEGYYAEWDGQYKHQQSAKRTLSLIVPAVIAMIFLLLYLTYYDLKLASIVLLSIPFTLVGGIYAIWLTGYNFSVAVWVGFIALFAVAVETAIVMVIYLENAYKKRRYADDEGAVKQKKPITAHDIRSAVFEGAMYRLRPKLMTTATTIMGLIPVALSTGIGSEVQKPLAMVLLGSLSSFDLLVTLLVIPALYEWLKLKELKQDLK